MRKILLIGTQWDPHVDVLGKEIARLGGKPVVLDARSLDNTLTLYFSAGQLGRVEARLTSGETIDVSTCGAVWFRLKPLIPLPSWGPIESSAAEFAQREWRTVLRSLQLVLDRSRWMNAPDIQAEISLKPRQLNLATRLGFRVPDTLITNDPEQVLSLLDHHNRIIYKALNGFVFPDQTGILTTEITKETVAHQSRAIKRAPGIYQEFVEKNYELRITIVEETVFPALVRTPKSGDAAIDWRYANFDDIFETYDLDQEVGAMLVAFQREAGLRFGTYDLIVDPEGEYVFLECNPSGQFLWLEDGLRLPIMASIAKELCALASI